ncbi:EF-hand domain-containing protein [Lysobacter tyrosinilyticus]
MKRKTLPILVAVLATAVLAAGCKKEEDTTITPPPAATEPAPAPATETPPPATEPMPATPAPAMPTDSGMSFEDMDKNKDGSVTKDELADTEMLSQHFATADKDGDGKLSKAEVDAHRAAMMAKPGG